MGNPRTEEDYRTEAEDNAYRQQLQDQAARNNSMRPMTAAEKAAQLAQARSNTAYDRIKWIRDYRAAESNRRNGSEPGLRDSLDEFNRRHPDWKAGDPVPVYVSGPKPVAVGSKGVNGLPLDMFLGSLGADLKSNRPQADDQGRAGLHQQAYGQWLRDVKALTHSLMGTVDRFNAVEFAKTCGTTWAELDRVQAFDETDDLLKHLADEGK